MTDATTENAPYAFVRKETLPQEPAPLSVAGPLAWIRGNLFSSPLNAILTLLCVWLVIDTVPGMIRFYFLDAVWTGTNRDACLADKVGRPVGACWAYVADRLQYFIYGSYPVAERWRVNIVFVMFALGVVWLLWNRMPLKKVGVFFFFVIMPASAFILLLGGPRAESFLRFLIIATFALAVLYTVLSFVPGLMKFWIGEGQLAVEEAMPAWQRFYRPKRLILISLVVFGLLAILADKIGLPRVDTGLWGGMTVTFLISAVGIVFSLPLGVLLALGRRSRLPAIQLLSVIFIEFVRGVPLITVLFMANTMLPLFVPQEWSPDRLLRPLIGVALFAAAYMAEVVRGGLQAMPKGQYEGAMSLGLGYWQMMRLIILPQALRIVIPGIVNTFIGLFKDTTLVTIVGIFDFLRTIEATLIDPTWATPTTRSTGYAFAAIFYFLCCWGMSRYSIAVEKRLAAGQKR
ncbi:MULTISPECIES: amino acid ABC transporter permease [Bosea]|uniref:amino acid ABC transporter permease n=1 Tax=Bosea TaxID=85413 RepID=UPI00214F97EC|nr:MULTISPECIES: amino acid ABC transporter permease [Bosea]MCR4520587.1 amino acid ABC transporter permease [Bosea sp. 47.2.35]MDR6827943.1 general L-amino acid transport system permease protein [Bosea robiniae]MDR6894363.1 general L-amino acid transport system permease protein [Bosea sp. BE109]MDR7138049.1 general L-amino acid transport system permease protein [Bosea sp. BE168]MDR7174748.1 general L-amino acid transport system permease protein [Bosea sp. BE271]